MTCVVLTGLTSVSPSNACKKNTLTSPRRTSFRWPVLSATPRTFDLLGISSQVAELEMVQSCPTLVMLMLSCLVLSSSSYYIVLSEVDVTP